MLPIATGAWLPSPASSPRFPGGAFALNYGYGILKTGNVRKPAMTLATRKFTLAEYLAYHDGTDHRYELVEGELK